MEYFIKYKCRIRNVGVFGKFDNKRRKTGKAEKYQVMNRRNRENYEIYVNAKTLLYQLHKMQKKYEH